MPKKPVNDGAWSWDPEYSPTTFTTNSAETIRSSDGY